ncbi:hypothetical protein KKH43_06775 [Patescibacteria group bacterium]|nr:hypothetical protein [Patescibacteria group bacterium]
MNNVIKLFIVVAFLLGGLLFVSSTTYAVECTDSSACSRGQSCTIPSGGTKGACGPSGGICQIDHECQTGETCVNDVCTTAPAATGQKACTKDAECGGTIKCVNGTCASTPASSNTNAAATPGATTGGTKTTSVTLDNPLGVTNIGDLIVKIINYILGFVAVVAAAVFIYGGLLYATSGGSEENAKKGKSALTAGIIGLVISLGAYTIIKFVMGALGAG